MMMAQLLGDVKPMLLTITNTYQLSVAMKMNKPGRGQLVAHAETANG